MSRSSPTPPATCRREVAQRAGITVVPLVVSFGPESFRPGVNLTTDEFWAADDRARRAVPDDRGGRARRLPSRLEAAFDAGADSVVCVCVSGDLSGTLKSAEVARTSCPDREIHIVDTRSASMGHGMLAQIASELAAEGVSGAEIARVLEHRKEDLRIFLALDTLEYLKRGGRISGARAAIGTMLNVKPIIAVENGDRGERGARPLAAEGARAALELLTQAPLERASILHTTTPTSRSSWPGSGRSGSIRRGRADGVVGPSVGPHLGPGLRGRRGPLH